MSAETVRRAAAETARMVEALRALEPDDWSKQTDCPLWDVRALAGHVLGMTETFTSVRTMARDMSAARRAAGKDHPMVDGLTAVQVARNADLTTDELIRRMAAAGPKQATWRGSRRLMRHIPMPQEMPDGTVEKWKFAFIVDTVLTRDTWMHRVDIAYATGKPMELTADHDGVIVADAVAEWARRHGQPYSLTLTGPAGGTFSSGTGGESITIDAVEFCRILSGRGTGSGLLTQEVPF